MVQVLVHCFEVPIQSPTDPKIFLLYEAMNGDLWTRLASCDSTVKSVVEGKLDSDVTICSSNRTLSPETASSESNVYG
jgi:hypothetical protein